MAQTAPLSAPQAHSHGAETSELTPEEGLASYFDQLRQHDGISLPYPEHQSPRKRRKSAGHDAVKLISVLYYQQKFEALEEAIEQFRSRSPARCSVDEKLNQLLESLKLAANTPTKNGTPHSPRRRWQVAPALPEIEHQHVQITSMGPPPIPIWSKPTPGPNLWPPPSLQSTEIDDYPDPPPSPTFSIRHAPKPSLDDISYPNLSPSIRNLIPVTVVDSPCAMARPKLDLQKTVSGSTSVNTSFTSISANTSFRSEEQGVQDPETPASSVGSISGFDGANNLDDRSLKPSLRAHDVSNGFVNDSVGNPNQISATQESDYGTWHDSEMLKHESAPYAQQKQTPYNNHFSRTNQRGQQEITDTKRGTLKPGESKLSSENNRVKRIPVDGIAGNLTLSGKILNLPFDLRFECARLIEAANITSQKLEDEWPEPRTFTTLQQVAKRLHPVFRSGSPASYENGSYHMTLRYTESKNKERPLFEPELSHPPDEQSTCWQRTFGFDRMLFVDTDSLLKPPKQLDLNKQKDHILRRFQEMLGDEQEFLGRTWLQFHVKTKDSKRGGLAGSKQHGAFAFIFVALRGDNNTLEPLTLHTLIDWALPIPENADASWCKMYARLDQRASRNTPVRLLTRDEIEKVDDKEATRDTPPNTRNDPRFAQQFEENAVFKPGVVMSDGCSEAPKYILQQCGQALGLISVPSAAQIRCAGGKGMIAMAQPTEQEEDDPDFPPPQIKISLSKSQMKVAWKSKDREQTKYDPYFFELSVNAASQRGERSFMYLDFLQILKTCGVPAENMEALLLRQTTAYKTQLLEAFEDSQALRSWLYTQGAFMEERRRNDGIENIAGFPTTDVEKAILMLDSGFDARNFAPLARLVDDEIENSVKRMISGFKVPLELSNMLFVVPDLTGSLGPEQAYLRVSKPLYDPITDKSVAQFKGWSLVSRLPAARDSDAHVVEFVYRPELDHLVDVLVLSTKGPQSVADMCSGGDFDGDRMWACQEPMLVKPFRNRPAPRELPDPASLGIKVDKKTFGAIIPDHRSEVQVREFVKMGTANRMRTPWVGIITKLHARVAHAKGLDSDAAIACADLKDRLMDSDKNGFSFDDDALEAFMGKWDIRNLPKPAYFKYTDKKNDDDSGIKKYQKVDPNHVVDRLYCATLKTEFDQALASARAEMKNAVDHDPDLTSFYDTMKLEARDNSAIQDELKNLSKKLRELNDFWIARTNSWSKAQGTRKSGSAWSSAVLETAEFYRAIEPLAKDTNPTVHEWCRRNGTALTNWDRLKASALAKFYEKGKLRFCVAGGHLCKLKAEAVEHRVMTAKAYCNVKPKKRKRQEDETLYRNGDVDMLDGFGEEDPGGGAEI